jgi:hypothetical protein
VSLNTVFPTTVELWLWHTSAFLSSISIIILLYIKKMVFFRGGLLIIIHLVSPGLYFTEFQQVSYPSTASKQRITAIAIAGYPMITSCKPVLSISSRITPLSVRHSMTDPAVPRSILDSSFLCSRSSEFIPAGTEALTACQKIAGVCCHGIP